MAEHRLGRSGSGLFTARRERGGERGHYSTGFSLRGLDKVAGEWDLVALAYNCKRLHKLKLEMAVLNC